MRVLERMRVLSWWFAGRLPALPPFAELGHCECCGAELGIDGCDRCTDAAAHELAFSDE